MSTPVTPRPRGPVDLLFGLYAWIVFLVFALGAVLSALLLPGLERRRRWVATFARLPFVFTNVPVAVTGLMNLPAGDCVVVANHASYLDGVLLQAYLPPRFSYVIKGEVRNIPVLGFLLRRIGSKFVDRFDASASARDARHLLRAARGGESLAFFPEGTFVARPGLGRFRPGAFAAATRAGIPLVPVVISGSRDILPAERILPRHGQIRIDILDPIDERESVWGDNRALSSLVRRRILAVLTEPDLDAESTAAVTADQDQPARRR
jgi:1-acyl-sn-glycerol-3-phosphate acyltransferase